MLDCSLATHTTPANNINTAIINWCGAVKDAKNAMIDIPKNNLDKQGLNIVLISAFIVV